VLCIIIAVSVIWTHKSIFDFKYLFIFSENLNGRHFIGFFESWSLAVEEWFYLVTPLLLIIAARIWPLRKAAPVIIVIVFLFSNAVRIYRVYKYGMVTPGPDTADLISTYIASSVPTRIDNIMFGVLGAYLNFYDFKIWTEKRNAFFIIGITGYLCNHFYSVFSGFNLYNLLFQKQVELLFILMTIPKVITFTEGKGAIARLITFIATISYSIYLVHMTIFEFAVRPRFPNNIWIQLPAYYLWAFGGACLLHITVEKWGLDVRRKLKTYTIGNKK